MHFEKLLKVIYSDFQQFHASYFHFHATISVTTFPRAVAPTLIMT